jgi:hypothetical protein
VNVSDIRSCYNLLEEEWIPVLWADGKFSRLGIREALAQAGRIRQVAASNPMDRVAILRFLLALAYWCRGGPPNEKSTTSGEPFPANWFSKLADNEALFNLLGTGKRFYQDSTARRPRTATDLIQEIPSGNNFWHLRHSTDGADGLCPACCAVGLLRLPLFSVSGLPDLKAGINGAPPVYVIRQGLSLLETLRANWIPHKNLGVPAWLKPDVRPGPDKDVPLLTGLTLLSRRVWLHDPGPSGTCIACGAADVALIRSCESESAGEHRNDFWNDPHVVYTSATPRRACRAADLTAARKFRMDRPWAYLLADIVGSDKFALGNRPTTFLVVGFATDKAKNIDVWERVIDLPSAQSIPATAADTLRQWNSESRRLEDRVARSEEEGAAAIAAIRPSVEDIVSSEVSSLLSSPDAPWEQAACEYGPMMRVVARSLSPGYTSAAVMRRRQIAGAVPDMRPRAEPAKKPSGKKGGRK